MTLMKTKAILGLSILFDLLFLSGCTFFLEDICLTETWPDDCSIIDDKEGKYLCQKCQERFPEKLKMEKVPLSAKFSSEIPACEDKAVLFTNLPMDLSDLRVIVPLGNLNPPGHTFPTKHLYFVGYGDTEGKTKETNIYSPGEIYITRIHANKNFDLNYTDYSLYFSPCQEMEGYFLHINSVSEKIAKEIQPPFKECQEYTTGGMHYQMCDKEVMIKLESEEWIGKAGGILGQLFDFGASDSRAEELKFANSKRWEKNWQTLHTVCAIDYFEPELKDKLNTKIGGWQKGEFRTIEPLCGEVNQDLVGTAQGNWFAAGTKETYPEDLHLALVHDNVNPQKGAFSVGNSVSGLNSGAYYFEPKHLGTINRDFSEVKADGKIYCYESNEAFNQGKIRTVLILQMISESELRIERLDVKNCSGEKEFSSTAAKFGR